jgi:hypothetical protein
MPQLGSLTGEASVKSIAGRAVNERSSASYGSLGVGRRGFLHVQKSEAQTYTTTLLNQARMSVGTRCRTRYSQGYAPVS